MKLEEMRAIADTKSPGDWKYIPYTESEHYGWVKVPDSIGFVHGGLITYPPYNAEVIAMAVNQLDKLIKVAEAVQNLFRTHLLVGDKAADLAKAMENLES